MREGGAPIPLGPRPQFYYGTYPGPPMYPPEYMGRERFPPGDWRPPDREYRYDPRQQ